MPEFKQFTSAVRKRFQKMSSDTLFVTDSGRDLIWEKYLGAFPAGTNPIFRTRTEFDCSCCRHFIRDTGNVVAIQNGALSTIWDLNGLHEPYQTVSDAMSAYVKTFPIRDLFLTKLAKHGTAVSHEMTGAGVRAWDHFSVDVPRQFVTSEVDEKRGVARTSHALLMRGFLELQPSAVAAVADLIQSNAIYRGQEFLRQVLEFQALQERFLAAEQSDRDLLAWTMLGNSVARLRNTVIGTLIQDLSDGVELERAVRSYETKVAPANYKRPAGLLTKRMVEDAMKTIHEFGLEPALQRRHARLSDVSVNSVLFVDNAVRGQMRGGIESLLMEEVKPQKFDPKRAEAVNAESFMRDILPDTKAVQLYVDNSLLGNFVSMTAPVHEDVEPLFRWGNNFGWSYEGNVADSIKDKVKRAGGTVDNVAMRVSLAWWNTDDLDLHCIDPSGNHIYYGNKSGVLDVDMNVRGETREPVENMRWLRAPRDGLYKVYVNNFTKRESVDTGFVVEIESALGLETLRYDKAVGNKKDQPVADIAVKSGKIERIKIADGINAGAVSQEWWGLKTLDLVRVNAIVLSPNYWDGSATGNKHWFFILEGCRNPLPARGIYNEFLHPRLEKHRKVFEVLGDKTKCPAINEQMSGVGFSSTRKDKATVVASGRPYTIVF
jgi:hypothetical protein